MAITFTNLGTSSNPDLSTSSNLNVYTNSTWTPPTTGIILCAMQWRQNVHDSEKPKISGHGLDWHLIAYGDADSGSRSTALYAAFASGATPGVTTWDFEGRTGTHFNAQFCQVTGCYEGGTIYDAFVQAIYATGSGTSGSVSMPAAASSNDRPYALFSHGTVESNTPRKNCTELDDDGASDCIQTQYRGDAMETTASATWATSETWIGLAFELREASVQTGITGLSMPYSRVGLWPPQSNPGQVDPPRPGSETQKEPGSGRCSTPCIR